MVQPYTFLNRHLPIADVTGFQPQALHGRVATEPNATAFRPEAPLDQSVSRARTQASEPPATQSHGITVQSSTVTASAPSNSRKPWTAAEDQRLTDLRKQNIAYKDMLEEFPGRGLQAISMHGQILSLQPKKAWTAAEDQRLTDLRKQKTPYKDMLKEFPGRSSSALRNRSRALDSK